MQLPLSGGDLDQGSVAVDAVAAVVGFRGGTERRLEGDFVLHLADDERQIAVLDPVDDAVGEKVLGALPTNESKALVKGKGIALPDAPEGSLPLEPEDFPLTVQLHNSATGVCLEASYAEADVKKNVEGKLKLKAQ